MKRFLPSLLLLVFMSCHEDIEPSGDPDQLIVGRWNSTDFAPERENMLTSIYAVGMTFYADHSYAMRYRDANGWWDGNIYGAYRFRAKETIELILDAGTTDESIIELQIDKLDEGVFWFRDSLLEFDHSPEPSEYRLEKVQ